MANFISRVRKVWENAVSIWDESFFRSEGEPKGIRKFLHFWVLVWRSFVRNRCPVRASALSFTTLLSLVPILAVAMSISSAFLKKTGETQIQEFIEQFVNRIIPQYDHTVTNAPAASDEAAPTDPLSPPATNGSVLETSPITNEPPLIESTNTVITALREAAASSVTNAPADTNSTPSMLKPPESSHPPIRDERIIAGQKEAAQYIHTFIQKTNSSALGVTGLFFLFITVILTLTRIEETFNDIWGVSQGRGWWTRITNYLSAIVFGPLLLVVALGLGSSPRIQGVRDFLAGMPFLEFVLATMIPMAVICLSFSLFYKLMPNTKVHFRAALVGGGFAGVAWHTYNELGFLLASQAVKADAIYGGVAVIPLFMGGLYVVWLTVLFGAQVAYAFQNREAYLQEKLVENVNQRGREFVALRLMTCIGQRYQRGLPLATVPEMSKELGIPSRLIQQVLHVLLSARLVIEVVRGEPAYAPARPLQDITAHHVLMAMRATQGQELMTRDEPVRAEVFGEFARIQAAEKEAATQISMLALVNRAQARLELTPAPAEDTEIKLTPAFVPPPAITQIEEEPPKPVETSSTPVESSSTHSPEPESQRAAGEKSEPVPEPPPAEAPRRTTDPSTDEERNFPL